MGEKEAESSGESKLVTAWLYVRYFRTNASTLQTQKFYQEFLCNCR